MEATHHPIEGHSLKDVTGILQDIDHTGMRTRGEHDDPFAPDAYGHVSLIQDHRIRFPTGTIERFLHVARHTTLVRRNPGDLTAQIEQIFENKTRFSRIDYRRSRIR